MPQKPFEILINKTCHLQWNNLHTQWLHPLLSLPGARVNLQLLTCCENIISRFYLLNLFAGYKTMTIFTFGWFSILIHQRKYISSTSGILWTILHFWENVCWSCVGFCGVCDVIFNQVAAGGSLQNVFVRLGLLGVMNPA